MNISAPDVKDELRGIVIDLLSAGIVIQFNNLRSLGVLESLTVTWESKESFAFNDHPFSTLAYYRSCLAAKQYTCMLFDYSIVQISYLLDKNTVVGHRLVYAPCPFTPDQDEIDLFGFEESLNSLDIQRDQSRIRMASALRFDYEPHIAQVDHPSSHLHIGSDSCRIPVNQPLSPKQFFLFIMRSFYPQLRKDYAFLESRKDWAVEECITPLERLGHHISRSLN